MNFDMHQATSAMFRAIEKSTEQKVNHIVDNNDGQFSRTMALREVFFNEQRAMRALSNALTKVTNYTGE